MIKDSAFAKLKCTLVNGKDYALSNKFAMQHLCIVPGSNLDQVMWFRSNCDMTLLKPQM